MNRKTPIIVFAFLLICGAAYAEDLNAVEPEPEPELAAITPAELQEALAKIQLEMQAAKAQVVTVRMDAETRQLFNRLEDKMLSLEQKLTVIEDRFMLLKNDMSDKIDSSAATTTATIMEGTDKRITKLMSETQQYVRDMTNPIRINLPNLGLWLMVTAGFMLIAGLRVKKAIKDADAEIKKGGKNG